jgi:hydroxymethylglutaryl-CoA lyase
LHSTAADQEEKLAAAVNAGCKRFDGTLKGIGGCPMASNELVGNMNSEWMIEYFKTQQILSDIDEEELQKALLLTKEIFQ